MPQGDSRRPWLTFHKPVCMLAIGDAVRLSITGPCPRCVMTPLPQGDLPRDVGILRTAAQHNQANVGVYASVFQGGKVRRGDSASLE